MKILAFANDNSAPAYHRVIMPLLTMEGVDTVIVNELSVKRFEGAAIFMYNRTIPEHWIAEVYKLRDVMGFKICVDIDDFWQLDPHHILFDEYKFIDFARQQIEHIKNADIVFTTHSRLAAEIKGLNPNVHVLPNAIPHKGQFDIERKPYHLTRLFWQGSITHRADINLLQRPLECLASISPKIKMIMGGYMPEEDEWYKMVLDYTAKTKHQYALLAGCHVKNYYRHYEHADICLIPLLNSPFNRHKSNLKVLEAANLGLPVICSQVHPYMDLPVIYAAGVKGWVLNIQKLVASERYQREAGAELFQFCDEHFNFWKINQERKQILEYEAAKNLV